MGNPYIHTTLYTQYHVPVLDRGTESGQIATVEEMLLEEQTVELMCNQLLGGSAQYETVSVDLIRRLDTTNDPATAKIQRLRW